MKILPLLLLPALTLLAFGTVSSLAFGETAVASPQRDALLGTYEGANCRLAIEAAKDGETDISFTDDMGERTLWGVGRSLEAQLARGATTLVFDHARESLGDMTIHLEVPLANGKPASMRGTGHGWVGDTRIGCAFGNR
jgi:hypothetical protein